MKALQPTSLLMGTVLMTQYIEKRINTEEKAKVADALWGDRIYSIPCLASYSAPGRYDEKDELHQDDMKKRMIYTRMI